jgi:hypothetical protein
MRHTPLEVLQSPFPSSCSWLQYSAPVLFPNLTLKH